MKILKNYCLVAKELTEEKKSISGLVIQHDIFKMYDQKKVHLNYCVVREIGMECTFFKKGDRIAVSKYAASYMRSNEANEMLLSEPQILARIEEDGSFTPFPENVIIKIAQEDRDTIFSKWITRDDGSKVQLFVNVEADKMDERSSALFVQLGTVISVGNNIAGIHASDTAILAHTVDNDENCIIGYAGDDKIIAIQGATTYHESDYIVYASRKSNRDQIVSKEGDYDSVSNLLGVIHNDQLIARDPYVFLEHLPTVIQRATGMGILYSEKQTMLDRKVLAIGALSTEKFGIKNGDMVRVSDFDTFTVHLRNGAVECINDVDMLCKVEEISPLRVV